MAGFGTRSKQIKSVQLDSILLDNTRLTFTLRRSNRRSVGLQISDDGLLVSAPHELSRQRLLEALEDRKIWILSRMAYWRQCQARLKSLEEILREGLPLPVNGVPHRLVYEPAIKRAVLNPARRTIHLPCPDPNSGEGLDFTVAKLENLLRAKARAEFERIARQTAEGGPFPPFKVFLSAARARWGSCNSNREVRLNWRLVYYPDHVVRYVIAHELSHLVEMNHSPRFWTLVESLMPDYKAAHDLLGEMNPVKVPLF